MTSKGNYADALEDKRSKGRKPSKVVTDEKPFTWCNVSLSDSAKEVIKAQEFDAARFFDWLGTLVGDGYKVTVSYDHKSDCFMVIVVGRDSSRSDYNVGVSSRHPDLEIALLTTQYKFEVLFMGGVIPTEHSIRKEGIWD